jgi:hypothetical protein
MTLSDATCERPTEAAQLAEPGWPKAEYCDDAGAEQTLAVREN